MIPASEYKLVEDPQLYASVDPEGIYTSLLSGMPPIMTREEVAVVLRLDPKTVTEYCYDRTIPGVPLPPKGSRRRLIIPKLSVIKYLTCADADTREDSRDG